jgi:hypothetical protein
MVAFSIFLVTSYVDRVVASCRSGKLKTDFDLKILEPPYTHMYLFSHRHGRRSSATTDTEHSSFLLYILAPRSLLEAGI